MKRITMTALLAVGLTAVALPSWGQDCPHHAQHNAHEHSQPAAIQSDSTSAGLSAAQRAQYLKGEGMGMAKPAELNHYPGPRHVLDNAERMKLSAEQLEATRALFAEVQAQAKPLGQKLVEREDELLRIFQSQNAEETRVKQLTTEIGSLQGELRAVHLTAHLRERALLSPEQVRVYDELRDYIPGERPAPNHQH